MPYQVQQIIKGKGLPVCVGNEDSVSKALSIMIENDYSQLPVVHQEDNFYIPDGLITYEGIIRGIRNFKAKIEDLKVRDVMVSAPVYSEEDDLFDILDRLKETNAVLVCSESSKHLASIVTSFDASDYFRKRTEDLMRVEDIEVMIKEFIKIAYSHENGVLGKLNEAKLQEAISRVTANNTKDSPSTVKKKTFEEITLSDYISILLLKDTWSFFEPIFGVPKEFARELLNGIREIRNSLAHFRGDISAEERDKLKFGTEWMTRCHDVYIKLLTEKFTQNFIEIEMLKAALSKAETEQIDEPELVFGPDGVSGTEASTSGGRYDALADYLQNQPGRIDQLQLTFNQIEELIQADLPASARNHRAWWSNDSVGHSHSQLWMDAGWRTTYINLSEGKVTFTRIPEREKAYIAFFNKLLDELRRKKDIPVRNVKPDGTSWIEMLSFPKGGPVGGLFCFSFSRNNRFRVELYLDLGDQTQTKAVFDRLYAQKVPLEAQLGALEWERLNNRRASRIAKYHDGQIIDDSNHEELILWAADTMVKFNQVMLPVAENAILEVRKG